LRIAQLAAEGLSNREVGGASSLAQHRWWALYRIFPKLGITGRRNADALK